MKKSIKELTEASIYLSIYAAIASIDRYFFGSFLDVVVTILISLIMFVHYIKYRNFKYVVMFCIGFLFVGFLISSVTTLVFTIPMVIVGYVFSYFYINKKSKYFPIIISGTILGVYEFFSSFYIMPIFGYKFETIIKEMTEIVELFSSLLPFQMLFLIITAIVLTGYVQALIIYMVIDIIFARIETLKVYDYNLKSNNYHNIFIANLFLIILITSYIFQNASNNDIIYMIATVFFVVSLLDLNFFAFIFIKDYIPKKMKMIFPIVFVLSLTIPHIVFLNALIGYLSLTKILRIFKWKN